MSARRDYTVTIVVEHVAGPRRKADWEGEVADMLEGFLEYKDLHTAAGAEYRIISAAIDDCTEVASG